MEEQILIGLDYSIASQELIDVLIEEASDPSIFYEIAKANINRPEILKLLFENPDTPEETRKFISDTLHLPIIPPKKIKKTPDMRAKSLVQKIQKLNVAERIQLAQRGGKEIRNILIKDPNKEVVLSVLDNQKITESEAEMIARSRHVPEEVLRKISKNREWMKSYSVTLALVTNPKTPPGISVTFISNLKTRDLKLLEKNKNVAEVVRSATKKLLKWRLPR